MKYLLYAIIGMYLLPLHSTAQTKQKETTESDVVVVTKNTDKAMILYVINNQYYLGDTVDILIPRLDVSKIQTIEQLAEQKDKLKHIEKVPQFSKKINDVFVIETSEKVDIKRSEKQQPKKH